MNSPAAAGLRRLLEGLRRPGSYPHPVGAIEILETHISAIVLTGPYAYKLKKPVVLPFLDFGTRAAREFYCTEELRLNRRTAPRLYLDVVPITGSEDRPSVSGSGPPLEHAVRMKQFPQEALFDSMARRGLLSRGHVQHLARTVASFHARCAKAGPGFASAGARGVLGSVCENMDELFGVVSHPADDASLGVLRSWVEAEHGRLQGLIDARLRRGLVRECHGDLHLGNVALIDGVPTAFDCIEFSDELRWIDVSSETAFMFMDLVAHGLSDLAWSFMDSYLQESGDYEGVALLRFHAVHRALVRAKVDGIRAQQTERDAAQSARLRKRCEDHLRLARELTLPAKPAIVIMHGLSGSGKSTVSGMLLERLGAIRCRSDVERKRLHGVAPSEHTRGEALVYGPESTARTYGRLIEIADIAARADYPVIVDAAFLLRAEREQFRLLAAKLGVPFAIASCTAPMKVLRDRVVTRAAQGDDASEARLDILERQANFAEPLAPEELASAVTLDTSRPDLDLALSRECVAAFAALEPVAR